MTTHREAIFVQGLWTCPSPTDTPLEVGTTSAGLQAIAFPFASQCAAESKDFMACKATTTDPQKCLDQGSAVTKCAVSLYTLLK